MEPIRSQVEAVCAPYSARVRVDRGDGLYAVFVYGAPDAARAIEPQLSALGLQCRARGAYLSVSPLPSWRDRVERWFLDAVQPSDLSKDLIRFRERPVCREELSCLTEGIKRLLLRGGNDYEQILRRTAAVALRKKSGGLLYACSLCHDAAKQGGIP